MITSYSQKDLLSIRDSWTRVLLSIRDSWTRVLLSIRDSWTRVLLSIRDSWTRVLLSISDIRKKNKQKCGFCINSIHLYPLIYMQNVLQNCYSFSVDQVSPQNADIFP